MLTAAGMILFVGMLAVYLRLARRHKTISHALIQEETYVDRRHHASLGSTANCWSTAKSKSLK
jgi:hypothetical protein